MGYPKSCHINDYSNDTPRRENMHAKL